MLNIQMINKVETCWITYEIKTRKKVIGACQLSGPYMTSFISYNIWKHLYVEILGLEYI